MYVAIGIEDLLYGARDGDLRVSGLGLRVSGLCYPKIGG